MTAIVRLQQSAPHPVDTIMPGAQPAPSLLTFPAGTIH